MQQTHPGPGGVNSYIVNSAPALGRSAAASSITWAQMGWTWQYTTSTPCVHGEGHGGFYQLMHVTNIGDAHILLVPAWSIFSIHSLPKLELSASVQQVTAKFL
jgi:hypothetical protein